MAPPPPPPLMPTQKGITVQLTAQAQNWDGTDTTLNNGPVVFMGTLPTFTRVAGMRYRLVVREWEVRQADADVASGGGSVVYNQAAVPTRNVLVYTDVFIIT